MKASCIQRFAVSTALLLLVWGNRPMAAGPLWTWMKGFSTADTYGYYGDAGVSHPDNVPGARYGSVSWKDSAGALWLFGGQGIDGEGSHGKMNDLWKYDPGEGTWIWMKGPSIVNQEGVYGERGVPNLYNVPGARVSAAGWRDTSGAFWLYSGEGWVSDDLWKYDPITGYWTWMKGASSGLTSPIYGTLKTPAPDNTPGRRRTSISWSDGAGNLWLFGGEAQFATGGDYNDLWRYTPATGNWAWMKGSMTRDPHGVYGALGVSTETNTPGGRRLAAAWTDRHGKLWLFGGGGFAESGSFAYLNDLWKYDPVTGDWTWIKGASTGNPVGVYGTLGVADLANTPGGRYGATSWVDDQGAFWLFGGNGIDSDGGIGWLNDLWRFDPATRCWTWMKGASTKMQPGIYGTPGLPDPASNPGSRADSIGWSGEPGTLWLFGGIGYDEAGNLGSLSDLWRLETDSETSPEGAFWRLY